MRERQREQREERARRRQIEHARALEQQRRRQERVERARNGGRIGPDDADDFDPGIITSEEDREEEEEYSEEVSFSEEFDEEGAAAEFEAGPSSRRNKRRQRSIRPERASDRNPKRRRVTDRIRPAAATATAAAIERRPRPSTATTARPVESYAWLSMAQYTAGFYVPQLGDDVVYVREGHASVLDATSDARLPPWKAIPRGRTMRAAEPCAVVLLDYVIDEASLATVARVTLELTDPASPLRVGRLTLLLLNLMHKDLLKNCQMAKFLLLFLYTIAIYMFCALFCCRVSALKSTSHPRQLGRQSMSSCANDSIFPLSKNGE